MVPDLIRETTFGRLVHRFSKGKLFQYPEQLPNFKIPPKYHLEKYGHRLGLERHSTLVEGEKRRSRWDESDDHDQATLNEEGSEPSPQRDHDGEGKKTERLEGEDEKKPELQQPASRREDAKRLEGGLMDPMEEEVEHDHPPKKQDSSEVNPNLVDWYDENDQENPQNWSFRKKCVVSGGIMLLTFSVYIGSAIYTPSIQGVMMEFGVSQTAATLGLSLFVLGYGIGPMFFCGFQEVPAFGRNPVYIGTLFLFVILQIPLVIPGGTTFGGLLACRFLSGFVGSPALATGGASLMDIWDLESSAYIIAAWGAGAIAGPTLGPVIGGFAAQANGWHWPLWELLWLSGFSLIVLFFLLPETLPSNILYLRSRRLRELTGNEKLKTAGEIEMEKMTPAEGLKIAFVRPFVLLTEPAVFFLNLYLGLLYGIFYLWFEAFPLTFVDIHHFNLGESGLPFLAILVGFICSLCAFVIYQKKWFQPRQRKLGYVTPEHRLEISVFAAPLIPISLFFYGWTARSSIHWIVPTIAAGLYVPGMFCLFNSVCTYLPASYPSYAASVLAGNAFFRSALGAAFPLVGRQMYAGLTIQGGCSLLAGLTLILMPFLFLIWRYGPQIRKRSRFVEQNEVTEQPPAS